MHARKKLAALIVAIAGTLRALGIESAWSTYHGSGDSGDGYETDLPEELESLELDVLLPTLRYVGGRRVRRTAGEQSWHVWAGRRVKSVWRKQTLSFAEALQQATEAAIEVTGHSGYENNEGGEGEFTILASSQASLEHRDNVDDTATGDYRWHVPIDPVATYDSSDLPVIADDTIVASIRTLVALLAPLDSVRLDYEADEDDDEYCTVSINDKDADDIEGSEPLCKSVKACWRAIIDYAGHERFWNCDSGEGALTVTAEGQVTLEHLDTVETTDVDAREFVVIKGRHQSRGGLGRTSSMTSLSLPRRLKHACA